jgi:hypothetical protein
MLFGASAGLAMSFSTAAFAQSQPGGSCHDRFIAEIENCNDMFHNPNPQHPDTFLNKNAHEACLEGADDSYGACVDDASRPDLYGAWIVFTAALRDCLNQFPDDNDPAQLACLRRALKNYRDTVRALTGNDDDDCAVGAIVSQFGTVQMAGAMDSLRTAATDANLADGKPIVEASSTVRFAAGINTSDQLYDVANIHCIQSAVLLAGYRTKAGVVVGTLDASSQIRDGVEFQISLADLNLVDTDQVALLAVFFDADGVPRLAEFGKLRIAESPVPGDWNRDGAKNAFDLADYFDAFFAQVDRADLNADQSHDASDAQLFLQEFTD